MIKKVFNKKISLVGALLALVVVCSGVYLFLENRFEDKIPTDSVEVSENNKLVITRDNSRKFAHPLRFFELKYQSPELFPVKEEIRKIISENNQIGNITSASIYLRNLETGEWISINEDQNYHPGSLFKVPMMIYYLKESEKNPELLNRKLIMASAQNELPNQTFNDKAIVPGKEYTIRELLKYMVSYSDNNATFLLNNYCNVDDFKKMFKDFNMAEPDVHNLAYTIKIKDYSIFLRTLYNATYLSAENSDYALSLLAESSFDKGLTQKIPSNIPVARKFGEMYDGNFKELHECGIIYCSNKPYMLAVMTQGHNSESMAKVISSISDTIFHFFCV